MTTNPPLRSLNSIFMKADDYDEITEGWYPIGDHQGQDGFKQMTKIMIRDKTIQIGRAYYHPETYELCFLVKYQQGKWKPLQIISDPNNKKMLENVNAVLSLSDTCELAYVHFNHKCVLMARLKDKEILDEVLAFEGESLKKDAETSMSP